MPSYRPVVREIPCPPSALQAFAALRARPGSVLLESGTREPRLGRYSILAADPFLTYRTKGREIEIRRSGDVAVLDADPFEVLRDILSTFSIETL